MNTKFKWFVCTPPYIHTYYFRFRFYKCLPNRTHICAAEFSLLYSFLQKFLVCSQHCAASFICNFMYAYTYIHCNLLLTLPSVHKIFFFFLLFHDHSFTCGVISYRYHLVGFSQFSQSL